MGMYEDCLLFNSPTTAVAQYAAAGLTGPQERERSLGRLGAVGPTGDTPQWRGMH